MTSPIVKEDYGLVLKIEGVELPSTYEVDFSNSENNGTSVTMIGNSDGVLIPRQFIDSGKDIFAFLYHVGADFGRTVYKFRIPNKLRPDRTEEQPTPEEQSVIDQAISALNTAVAKTAQDVVDAEASAQAAGYDADRAEEARSASLDYAEQAEASATSAEQSATASANSASASAQSASQSAQIKADVEDLADDTQASADASAQSATASANSASQASASATSASQSASSASGYATSAQTSAQTATAKASEASGYASTASAKATESAQSASQALSYKTDAESAKTASQTAQGLAESARDSAISAKNDTESARDDAESARDEAVQAVASISGALDNKADVITDTASGAVASFPDGADGIPLKSLVVNIDPVQDLSNGDPSPTNLCPISGWTGVGVEQSGKNLLSKPFVFRPVPSTLSDCFFAKAGTYSFSFDTIDTATKWRFGVSMFDADGNALNSIAYRPNVHFAFITSVNMWYLGTDVQYKTFSFTLLKDCYIRIWFGSGDTTTSMTATGAQLELGSTATPYEPYTGRSITIDLGQTVYGGKLDVLSGELTVYPYYASYNGETLTGRWISDRDAYAVGTTPTIGAQVVNIGAQGTEYQLTPQQVSSLYGVNNIWADSGDTEVVYRADTKLFIERLTAPDSADMIADSNIVSGQYFMVGNNLYKATANIASGSAVIVGTNATRKSLSEALNEINA